MKEELSAAAELVFKHLDESAMMSRNHGSCGRELSGNDVWKVECETHGPVKTHQPRHGLVSIKWRLVPASLSLNARHLRVTAAPRLRAVLRMRRQDQSR